MNRKYFLKTFAFGLTSTTVLLSACGNDTSKTQTGPDTNGPETVPEKAVNNPPESNADCNDISSLSKADLAPRMALEYVPVSIEPDKFCINCRFFKIGSEPNGCAGCQLFKGPVNTKGYCKSWFTKG